MCNNLDNLIRYFKQYKLVQNWFCYCLSENDNSLVFFSDKYLLPTFSGYCPRSYGGVRDEISMFPARAVKCAESLNRVRLFATSWTVACQVPLPMEFSRQEYWSGLSSPSPGDLTQIKPKSPASPVLAGGFFTSEVPWKSHSMVTYSEMRCRLKEI